MPCRCILSIKTNIARSGIRFCMPLEAFDGVLFVVTDVLVAAAGAAVTDAILADAPDDDDDDDDDDINASTDDGTKRMPSAVARMVANNSIKRCCR